MTIESTNHQEPPTPPLLIASVGRSALDWWDKLDKWKQRTIERETFGDGEPWEDNTLVEADIITMYKRHYA